MPGRPRPSRALLEGLLEHLEFGLGHWNGARDDVLFGRLGGLGLGGLSRMLGSESLEDLLSARQKGRGA